MKKSLIILSLFLGAFATKVIAQKTLTISNTTPCDVTVFLYAEDACSPPSGCGYYVSQTFIVPANSQISFDDPTDLNFSSCAIPGDNTGWSSCYPSCIPSSHPWGWDGIDINESSFTSADIVVGPGTCISVNSNASPDCNSSSVYAIWIVGMTSNIVQIHN